MLIWPAGRRGRCSFDSVEPRGKGGVLAAMKAVGTRGKGGVLAAMKAVGTRGKGGVLAAMKAVGTWKYEKDP